MHPLLRPLAFGLTLCLAVAAHAQQLRTYGTNLYDFSPVVGVTPCAYLVAGTVTQIGDEGVTVQKIISSKYYMLPDMDLRSGSSSDLLRLVAQNKLAQKPMTAGEYFAMSPSLRGKVRAEHETQDVLLCHFSGACRIGGQIQAYALPMAGRVQTWDCGQPAILQDLTNFTSVFKVTTKGIRKEKLRWGPPSPALTNLPAKK